METGRLELFLGSMFSGKSSKIINGSYVIISHLLLIIHLIIDTLIPQIK